VRHGTRLGPERNVQPILKRIAPLTTANPQASERLQKAVANTASPTGTIKPMRSFQRVQVAVCSR